MRKKVKIYSLLIVFFIVAAVGAILWNNLTIKENEKIVHIEEERHSSLHHLFMEMKNSQEELYKYEAGYSPDLDKLIESVEMAEQLIAGFRKDQDAEGTEYLPSSISDEMEIYKRLLSEIVTSSNDAIKSRKVHETAQVGDGIGRLIEGAEHISGERVERLKAENLRLKQAADMFLFLIIFMVIAGGAVAYAHFRRTVVAPFDKLIKALENISREGKLNLRVSVPDDSDLAMLSTRINEMMDNLERWDEELKCNYEEMKVTNEELQNSYANMEELTAELEEKSQELAEVNEELVSIDRLKNEFMQNVSHELRTPLTPIMGYLELFISKDLGELSPIQLEIVNDMYHCSRRLGFIIDSLLEMITLQEEERTEKYESFDTETVVREVENMLKDEVADKGLSFKVTCSENLPPIIGAKKKFILMLNHILKNAVKFTAEGGDITFEVRNDDRNYVEFVVKDNGIGINEKKIKSIFKPFLQVDSSTTRGYEGIGLGLALVKKVVEIHKGKIDVKSKEGEGTTFTVLFPVS